MIKDSSKSQSRSSLVSIKSTYQRNMNLFKSFDKLLVTMCCLFLLTSQAHANILNKFRSGFYFEKYSTTEEAKEELLKLCPIGSDADKLMSILEKIGAKKIEFIERKDVENESSKRSAYFTKSIQLTPLSYSQFDISKDATSLQTMQYNIDNIINPIVWKCSIWMNKERKIIDVSLGKGYMGL